jgi:hypothetical protein
MKKYDFYLVRVRKPHRCFSVGDILLGDYVDGGGLRLVCCGYSNKLQRTIRNYSLYSHNGYITVLAPIQLPEDYIDDIWGLLSQPSHDLMSVKSTGEFLRQLRLSGGNLPLWLEAATIQPHIYEGDRPPTI